MSRRGACVVCDTESFLTRPHKHPPLQRARSIFDVCVCSLRGFFLVQQFVVATLSVLR